MYDMYPEWGPAGHDPENPRSDATGRRPGRARPARQRRPAPRRQLAFAACPTHRSRPGTLRLAVIPGDGIGPEVTAEALKVLERGRGRPAVKFEPTRYDLGAERYLATGEVLPDSVLAEIREHDAILLGAVGGKPGDPNLPPRASSSAACCCGCASSSTTTSTCGRRGSTPGAARRWPTRARSTSWSSARAPRAPTPATAARCGSARRTRSRPRSASTPRSAWSASSATRSPGRSSGRARS